MYKKLHQQTRKDAKKIKIFTKFNVDKMLNIKQKQRIMVPFLCIANFRVGQLNKIAIIYYLDNCDFVLLYSNLQLTGCVNCLEDRHNRLCRRHSALIIRVVLLWDRLTAIDILEGFSVVRT